MQPQINYYVTKLTLQAETWKTLESHENELETFTLTCMLTDPELIGRLGECAAQKTVSRGKVWNTASPQSWRLLCQGWSCQGLLISVLSMFLGKESFPIHSLLSPNPIHRYVMRHHCIYNMVDIISLVMPHFFVGGGANTVTAQTCRRHHPCNAPWQSST